MLVRLCQLKVEVIMVRNFIPAKTGGGVGYLQAVGRPTRAQEDELYEPMIGLVGFTSVYSCSARKKKGDKVQKKSNIRTRPCPLDKNKF